MNAINYFSTTYAEARIKFLETCAALGLAVEHHIHPERGCEGEELATDVARFGPDNASHVLFTMSATHGVEGFCGSGAQIGALRFGLYNDLPDGIAVVLIHAINTFGFSWLRRVTHENVDLNRNHLDHTAPYPVNEGYELLRDAICLQQWTEDSQAAARAILDAYAQAHGHMALQAAISGESTGTDTLISGFGIQAQEQPGSTGNRKVSLRHRQVVCQRLETGHQRANAGFARAPRPRNEIFRKHRLQGRHDSN